VAVAAGVLYIYARRERFAAIAGVPVVGIVALVAVGFCFRATEAVMLRDVLRELGSHLGVSESQLISWSIAYWNLLPLKPGTGGLGIYLKRRHGISFSDFGAYLLAVNLLRMAIRGTLGLGLSVPLCALHGLSPLVPSLFAGLLGACVAVMLLPLRWEYAGRHRLLRIASRASRSWHEMRGRHGLLARVAGWKLLESVLGATALFLCFRLTGTDIGFTEAFTVQLVASLSRLAAVVPAQLGVREALTGAAGMAFGFTFADGVVAAALRRAVSLTLVAVVGPLSSWALHRLWTAAPEPVERAGAGAGEGGGQSNSTTPGHGV
jgi:uncharacterized membrane protein YbhN (UPF0104 family)